MFVFKDSVDSDVKAYSLIVLTLLFRHVWTVSAAVVKTPTWPTERRSWRPLLSPRKPWSRLASRWESTSPVSRRQRSEVQPPALPGTPFSTSPRQRGHRSQPPFCRGRDMTAGPSTIHWRCGSTAEVRQSVATHIPCRTGSSGWACLGPAGAEPEQGSYGDRR